MNTERLEGRQTAMRSRYQHGSHRRVKTGDIDAATRAVMRYLSQGVPRNIALGTVARKYRVDKLDLIEAVGKSELLRHGGQEAVL